MATMKAQRELAAQRLRERDQQEAFFRAASRMPSTVRGWTGGGASGAAARRIFNLTQALRRNRQEVR